MTNIIEKLLPEISCIALKSISENNGAISIQLLSTQPIVLCPVCNSSCSKVHSKYNRYFDDLPWSKFAVKIKMYVRKFFCDNDKCSRKIFTERFSNDLAPYARRTTRLLELLQEISFDLGGNKGSVLAEKSGIKASPSTLLRVVHRLSPGINETPRVLGVDDWAFKKGNNYGTILVDLEKRQPVDLLPDRTADTLSHWLKMHPGVEIISRDRSGSYALGATQGAPEAVQIADRWHLLKNLGEAVKRMLNSKNDELKKAAQTLVDKDIDVEEETVNKQECAIPTFDKAKEEQVNTPEQRRISMQEIKFAEVKRLQREGHSIKSIHRLTGAHRQTIKKYFEYEHYPHVTITRRKKTSLYKFEDFIRKEWKSGERNKAEIWRKIISQGYTGSRGSFYEFVKDYSLGKKRGKLPKPLKLTIWSARKVSVLVSQKFEDLEKEEQDYLRILYRNCPEINTVSQLVRRFKKMTDELGKKKLDNWIKDAQEVSSPALKNFATGLLRDYAAVRAAVSLKWSNGQVEGQVNRLKNIKRQMYGRGSFELLKKKVLRHTG